MLAALEANVDIDDESSDGSSDESRDVDTDDDSGSDHEGGRTPVAEAPATRASATRASATQAPAARASATQAPAAEAPPPAADALRRAIDVFRGVLDSTSEGAGTSEGEAESGLAALPPSTITATLEALGMPPSHARLVPNALAHRSVRVAFWSNQLCERGTEVALYDYADFGERLLGFEAWIMYPESAAENFGPTIAKFRERFGERLVALRRTTPNHPDQAEVDAALRAARITHVVRRHRASRGHTKVPPQCGAAELTASSCGSI